MFGFVLFTVIYFCYCVLFFEVVQKPAFGLYNRVVNTENLTAGDIRRVYSHGFVSDLIIASYLTALPLLVSGLHTLLPCFNAGTVLLIYNIIISIAVSLICVSDTLLYRFWGYKLDSSAFVYLRSLKGTFASVSTGYIIGSFTLVALCAALFFAGAEYLTAKCASALLSTPWLAW